MRHAFKTITLAAVPLLLASPAFAAPVHRLSIGGVFGDAAPPVKFVALMLVGAILAAPAMLALGRGARLDVLAKGAPLLTAAACLFTLLAGAVGVSNSQVFPSPTVLAPAFAEMLLLLVLGALATFAAVVCRELAKPRIIA